MKKSDFLSPAPPNFIWPQCPDADIFVRARLQEFLSNHAFASRLSERMQIETNTEFLSWVDHIVLPIKNFNASQLTDLGYRRDTAKSPAGTVLYWHPFADLPRLALSKKDSAISAAIMVDSISDFQLAQHLSLPIQGAPFSKYRETRVGGEKGELMVIERRGTRAIVPENTNRADRYLSYLETWTNRRRLFPTPQEGMVYTRKLAKKMVSQLGSAMAAWAFLEGERRYWMSRNRAAQVQKARQDKLGLGWANHDHHTFRSGRPAFSTLIQILMEFGFKKRERYYAGAEAGWGAQVMEQPEARLIIFADVDLTPEEIVVDFTTSPLKDLKKPGTVGLWCMLHGESMLEAGMHHLEAKFHFDGLRESLKEVGVGFMKPFSDFPHLRQAFSEGEIWRVSPKRLDELLARGSMSKEAYDRIYENGAVGSHLENLQRRNGFKGFNQRGVSDIIRAVNPETQALKKEDPGASS